MSATDNLKLDEATQVRYEDLIASRSFIEKLSRKNSRRSSRGNRHRPEFNNPFTPSLHSAGTSKLPSAKSRRKATNSSFERVDASQEHLRRDSPVVKRHVFQAVLNASSTPASSSSSASNNNETPSWDRDHHER